MRICLVFVRGLTHGVVSGDHQLAAEHHTELQGILGIPSKTTFLGNFHSELLSTLLVLKGREGASGFVFFDPGL